MPLRKHSKTSNWMRLWIVRVTEPKGFRERKAWVTELIVQSTSELGAERAVRSEHPELFTAGVTIAVEQVNGYVVRHLTYRAEG